LWLVAKGQMGLSTSGGVFFLLFPHPAATNGIPDFLLAADISAHELNRIQGLALQFSAPTFRVQLFKSSRNKKWGSKLKVTPTGPSVLL
jgi:hypothetical protein